MSRDVKYIGMDVHKEAVVIASSTAGGKRQWSRLSKPRPAASAVYPRSAGRVACDLGRGTWAAWLYDLLQPQVAQ